MGEELEGERRRDGIGNVGDAEVKVRQLDLEHIAHEHLQFVFERTS